MPVWNSTGLLGLILALSVSNKVMSHNPYLGEAKSDGVETKTICYGCISWFTPLSTTIKFSFVYNICSYGLDGGLLETVTYGCSCKLDWGLFGRHILSALEDQTLYSTAIAQDLSTSVTDTVAGHVRLLWPLSPHWQHVTSWCFGAHAPQSLRWSSRFCFSRTWVSAVTSLWLVARKYILVMLSLNFSYPCWVNDRILPCIRINWPTWQAIACMYRVTYLRWYTVRNFSTHLLDRLSYTEMSSSVTSPGHLEKTEFKLKRSSHRSWIFTQAAASALLSTLELSPT